MIHLSKKATKRLAAGGLFFTVFALSAGSFYFLLPQSVVVEKDNSAPMIIPDDPVATNKERFISKLANSATNGLSINVDKLILDYDGKTEVTVDDQNVEHSQTYLNRIDASGTTIDFKLSSLSLQGINLALTAPVVYSDGKDVEYRRGVHASMFNHTLYLNLFDWEEGQNGKDFNSAWNFKYKVDMTPYDMLDQNGLPVSDEITGGIKRYEYGKLDWLIEDILAILSDGGINLSLEGWLNSFMGESSAPAVEGKNDPAQTNATSDGGMDINAILASMEKMAEYKPSEDESYFIWDLDLGAIKIPLGLRADADLNFTGVDLPSKYVADKDGNVSAAIANASWEIQEGLRLSASATITEFDDKYADWSAANLVPDAGEGYLDLYNSRYLLETIATYIAKPTFGLDVDLDLGHASEGSAADRTHVAKKASQDAIRVALSANADLTDRKFHGAGGSLSLQKVDAQNQVVASHGVNLNYVDDEAFLDINGDLFKARTSKAYLDEFYSQVLKDVFASNPGSAEEVQDAAEGTNTLNQVREILNKIGLSIDSILDSRFLTDLGHGVYHSAVDFIESITSSDNKIELVLSLDPIGLSGTIKVVLQGSINAETEELNTADLLSITIEGVKLASFTLNGTIKTRAYEALPSAESYDDSYARLEHLKGIGEQIKGIVNEKAFSAKLGVTLSHEENNEKAVDLGVDGDIALSFDEGFQYGKADVRLNQGLTDKVAANHRIAVDFADGFSTVGMAYESANDASALNAFDEDAVQAKLGLNTFLDLGESLLGRASAIDDRFTRLINSLTSEASSSIISRVTDGEVSALLEENGIIKSAQIHDGNGNTKVVVNGSKLGLDGDLEIVVAYKANAEDAEGGLDALKVLVPLGEKKLEIELGSIEAKPVTEENKGDFRNFESVEDFHDISFIGGLLEYAVGTLTLGTTASDDGVSGISYYGIAGDLGVQVGPHNIKVGLFDAYASVEGAETKVYASLGGIPVIRGVNGPDSSLYFRPNEVEGDRVSEVYFYANGVDPKGQALLTRDSSYGAVRNVRDGVRLDGDQFMDGLVGWIGRYSLGICDDLLDGKTTGPKARLRGGLLGDEGLRIEKLLAGFDHAVVDGADHYILKADLGELLGIASLGEASITIKGQTVAHSGGSFKTLTGINVHADASLKASNSNSSLRLAAVDVDLYLNNIKNGVMENVWDEGYETANFANNFVGDVADDGILTEESKGVLFDMPHLQFHSLDMELGNHETRMYGYNFAGQGAVTPSNLFKLA